jgi:hypothetical protein
MARFGVAFDGRDRMVRLHDLAARGRLPYLFHGGRELPMLLDGTKQFGYQEHLYPPHRHDGEDLFDHHVAADNLHKEIVLEPFNPTVRKKDGRIIEGFRRVYYTRKGEEWRISAWHLLWSAAEKQRWNEGSERLSSMLFGYEEWQTEWWLTFMRENKGGWGGLTLYFSVGETQLRSMEAAGFRAFPPVGDEPLTCSSSELRPTDEEAARLMDPNAVALVRAIIRGRYITNVLRGQSGPSYSITNSQIAELNRNIVGELEVITRRSPVVTRPRGRYVRCLFYFGVV